MAGERAPPNYGYFTTGSTLVSINSKFGKLTNIDRKESISVTKRSPIITVGMGYFDSVIT